MNSKKILIFFCTLFVYQTILPAQEFEIWLRLSTRWRLDNIERINIHPDSDYQMLREYNLDLLPKLIEQHYKGNISFYNDESLRKNIPPDSIDFYFGLVPFIFFDSLRASNEIFYANEYKAWFPEGYSEEYGDGEWPEDYEPEPDSLTGWDELRIFRNYHVSIKENWSLINNALQITNGLMRIDIIKADDNFEEAQDKNGHLFPHIKVFKSIYLREQDWNKISPGEIFESNWTSIQGPDLKELFGLRNFPALISSIKQAPSSKPLFRNEDFGYKRKDSLLEIINYKEFYRSQANVRDSRETLILSPLILQMDTRLLDEEKNPGSLKKIEKTVKFFSSPTFKKIWDQRNSHRIVDRQNQKFKKLNHSDSIHKFQQTLLISGQLKRTHDTTVFIPTHLILIVEESVKDYDSISKYYFQDIIFEMDEIDRFGLKYKGQDLRRFFSSLDFYFYPVEISGKDVETYEQAVYLREMLLNGKWEGIEEKKTDYWSCDFPLSLIPSIFNPYKISD